MTRRHLTKSGRFEVGRRKPGAPIGIRHAATGEPSGMFVAPIVTIAHALACLDNVENAISAADLTLIDESAKGFATVPEFRASPSQHEALLKLKAALLATHNWRR